MSVSEMHARVKGKVWQALAQSGVDLSPLSQEDVDTLVTSITTGVLSEVDEVLAEAAGQPASTFRTLDEGEDDDEEERVLWEGRPFLSLNTRYQITTERIRVVKGIMGKDREDIELVRVQDIDQTQGVSERMLGVGDIHVRSHDPSSPEMVLNNVANPLEVHEILRRAVLKARKRHNLYYREEM